ncbi:MAG TPA: PQQ-binding-like beta-propeller repeat protein [Gaiellaceae bacterium]
MRRALLVGAAAALALLGAGGGYVLYVRHEGRDVRGSPTVEFRLPRRAAARPARPDEAGAWLTYGFDAARLRFAPAVRLRPPFRRRWTFHGRTLLEFPPAVAGGRVFLPTFDGRFYALDARTGRTIWRRATGRCGWASPAVHRHLVVVTFIGHACDSATPGADGIVLALDTRNGGVRWRRVIGPTESSPLVVGGLVYVGDWLGRVYALSERTGRTVWTFATGGKIKGSAAFAAGRIYIGSYDGRVYALNAWSGREVWRASGQPRLGGSGTFYSTPAVAYDRVYIGSTDGKVYSFGAETGKLRWSYGTGGYVYASPAVWRDLVLVGSYDHDFYALDAATGELRWRFRANGPISGSASVVDGVVYFSTFAERTYGLDARTGRLLWTFPDGKYSPVVADRRRLYLVGWGRLYGMEPAR